MKIVVKTRFQQLYHKLLPEAILLQTITVTALSIEPLTQNPNVIGEIFDGKISYFTIFFQFKYMYLRFFKYFSKYFACVQGKWKWRLSFPFLGLNHQYPQDFATNGINFSFSR